jgi:hypothetical protein
VKKLLLIIFYILNVSIAHGETQYHMNGGDTQYQKVKTSYPPILWEVMGVSEDDLFLTRIERFPAPEGWIIKIITMNSSKRLDRPSLIDPVKYMYIPDAKHTWKFYSNDYKKLLEIKNT